ncbi:hypothetical protein C367_04780 [Cryptococcus neoformans Ze90-1]|nr:hypothetical protein C367_04780 [Cryptococcus neoformans var. grubii Ze90-1]
MSCSVAWNLIRFLLFNSHFYNQIMEDPWTIPAWSTPAKPPAKPETTILPSNPWGAPPTPAGPSNATFEDTGKTKSPAGEKALGLPDLVENAWGAESEAATLSLPTLSTSPIKPKVEADPDPGAVWGGDPASASAILLPGSPKASSKSTADLAAGNPLPETPVLSARSAAITHTLPRPSLSGEEAAFSSRVAPEGDHGAIWGNDPVPLLSAPSSEEITGNFAVNEPTSTISTESPIGPPLLPQATGLQKSTSYNSLSKPLGALGGSTVENIPTPTLPKSPSFGEEFGGFSDFAVPAASSSDPWGSNTKEDGNDVWGNDDWDTSLTRSASSVHSVEEVTEEGEATVDDEEGAWGAPPVGHSLGTSSATKPRDDDWEEARRRIKIQEERAPREKMEELKGLWTKVAENVMAGGVELEKMTGAEELQYEQTINRLFEDAVERLRSLSTVPPEINTYPPVLSSLVTHERFNYSLQRPNLDPSSSLLSAAAHSVRRPKRVDTLSLSLTSNDDASWSSRSRLGEPENRGDGRPEGKEEGNKSRWSFWGRRPASERQLTTSGGGILEVKPMTPTATGGTTQSLPSSDAKPPSIPASRAASISVPSRSTSPPPSIHQTPMTEAQPLPLAKHAAAPAPSAVSRFFGRLSRRPSQQPSTSTSTPDVDAKDFELSASDFSFLSDIPGAPEQPQGKGVADLLSLEPGANEPIASLESLLSSKVTSLPKPLAPPPKPSPGSTASAQSGAGRSTSGRFVARMKAPSAPQPNDMDLLGGLDFGSPGGSGSGTPNMLSPASTGSGSAVQGGSSIALAWDDFAGLMSSGASSGQIGQSTSTNNSSITPSKHSTLSTSLSSPPSGAMNVAMSSAPLNFQPQSPAAPKPSTQHISLNDDFGDFGNFGSTSNRGVVSSAKDDSYDFGDFSSPGFPLIHTPSTKLQSPTQPPLPLGQLSSSSSHSRPPSVSFDHSHTLNLLSGASASKGKRWPAPPSPLPPQLEPPPRASSSNSSKGFPFLIPPPPGGSAKRGGDLLGDVEFSAPSSGNSKTTTVTKMGTVGGLGAHSPSPTPPRSLASTPVSSLMGGTTLKPAQTSAQGTGNGKGGLSAQDLSFFDSL